MRNVSVRCILICVVLSSLSCVKSDFELGFYDKSCPTAEKMIFDYVKQHVPNAPSLAAALLRMHFHDCFVRGCDASVLINSTRKHQAEKSALPNQSLRGFDFLDRVKSLVEAECPGVVSCADIIALVARDSVVAIGGPYWNVPTGRRDGLISRSSEAFKELPAPTFDFTALRSSFSSKGLNLKDLVVLSGAHTIGVSHCQPFSNRLYNFTGRGDEDPSLDSFYAADLRKNKCKTPKDTTTIVEMDPGSFRTFDLGYYKHLLRRRGLFRSDAALATDAATKSAIIQLVNSPLEVFFREFGLSMEKMGRIEVKTGSAGEIRKNCAVINRERRRAKRKTPCAQGFGHEEGRASVSSIVTLGDPTEMSGDSALALHLLLSRLPHFPLLLVVILLRVAAMTCDLEVDVNGEEIFLVDKSIDSLQEVLSSFCGRVRKLIDQTSIASATKPLKVAFTDLPGGAEAFELMTRLCYNNVATRMTPRTTCLLHSVAHFMEMTDGGVSSSVNLLKLIHKSLEGIPYWSWSEIVRALRQCQDLFPVASTSGLMDRILESLAGRITAASDVSPAVSSPESSAFRFSFDTRSTMSTKNCNHRAWWFEDLVVLNPAMIEKIVKSMVLHKVDQVLISRFLAHYLKSAASNASSSDKKEAAETIINLLHSLDASCVSCKGLFGVLRISSSLKISKCCQSKLESMIGNKFDQATLDNLLVPAPSGTKSLYDAGSLMDSYLAEVAPDSSLKPLKFVALATALPDEARDSHDAIYGAIDMYLEVHTQLSGEEKMKMFCAINYEKLSSESCKHLASNRKFPSRTAIRALISQQSKLRSLLKEVNQLKKHSGALPKANPSKENRFSDDEQIILYAKKVDLSTENEKLKSQLQGMQWKVMELERICRKMQAQMARATKKNRTWVSPESEILLLFLPVKLMENSSFSR
ncbi:unnamed protein product [Musa acuminata var. zebrina]